MNSDYIVTAYVPYGSGAPSDWKEGQVFLSYSSLQLTE
jgi:hypothetical protein